MVEDGVAICVPGNHETKLQRKLSGRNVKLTHGLAETMEQLEGESEAFIARVKSFIAGMISHYILDRGRLVVAHAGMKEAYQGRGSGTVRAFALYGETTGETDEYGFPVRYDWASEHRGDAMVVYGHTPVAQAEWLNNTICIDAGCVFGGKLTALRYPEKELVHVPLIGRTNALFLWIGMYRASAHRIDEVPGRREGLMDVCCLRCRSDRGEFMFGFQGPRRRLALGVL